MAETAADDTPNSFASAQQFQNNDVESPESAMEQRQLFPSEDGDPTFIVNAVDVDDDNNNNDQNQEENRRILLERLRNLAEDVNMDEVENDNEDIGNDGNDSDCDAAEMEELNAAQAESSLERLQVLIKSDDDGNNDVLDSPENCISLSPFGLCPMPENVAVPKAPDDWVLPEPKTGQPPHVDVDNPGGWCTYSFQAKFAHKAGKGVKKNDYLGHKLPTGAQPVPVNAQGNRTVDDWEFHYKKWKNDGPQYRSGATHNNPFPSVRKGTLDYELLKKMGLNKTRLLKKDCLFFYQLLFPICDPKKSDIEDDPRCGFYSDCERWTGKYASSIGLGGSYGHYFKSVTAAELLIFDMAVVRDGVLGGSHGSIFRRWSKNSSTYDSEIASAITYSRWLELKRTFKLCDNDLAPKKNQPNYDPAYKYDYIYYCLVKNTNEMTLLADLDLCGDETTCGHGGFGEAGSGLLSRRKGKPGVTFGMQTVLVSDVHRNRIRAYTHRHRLHPIPEGWNKEGPREVRRIITKLKAMVIGETASSSTRQIFSEKPHSTWDNHFSGDQVMDYLGVNGWSATMTCARNRLPSAIPDKYLQKEKTEGKNLRARVGRFNNPITIVAKKKKMVRKKTAGVTETAENQSIERTWTRVHVSFQSTSSTNISTVNALNGSELYVRVKERGKDRAKRRWAIEMNPARDLYLATYGRIDTIDSLIKNCQLYYRSWKYWHASKLHVLALGLVSAYDMYKEVMLEGYSSFGLEKEEAKKLFLDFHSFREQLSTQGLSYSAEACSYPGDRNMRVNTKRGKRGGQRGGHGEEEPAPKRRVGRPRQGEGPPGPNVVDGVAKVTPAMLKTARGTNGRLCGNLDKLIRHRKSLVYTKHGASCAVCGDPAFSRCMTCGVQCHDDPRRGVAEGRQCFLELHSDVCFGLLKTDCALLKTRQRDWKPATTEEKEKNKRYVENLDRDVPYSLRSRRGRSTTVSPDQNNTTSA